MSDSQSSAYLLHFQWLAFCFSFLLYGGGDDGDDGGDYLLIFSFLPSLPSSFYFSSLYPLYHFSLLLSFCHHSQLLIACFSLQRFSRSSLHLLLLFMINKNKSDHTTVNESTEIILINPLFSTAF